MTFETSNPRTFERREEAAQPRYHFIYCEHIPLFAKEIVASVGTAPIIAMEGASLSFIERMRHEHVLQLAANTPNISSLPQDIQEIIEAACDQTVAHKSTSFTGAMAYHLIGTGKTIRTIDFDFEQNLILAKKLYSLEEGSRIIQEGVEACVSVNLLRDKEKANKRIYGEFNRDRNKIIVGQLLNIGRQAQDQEIAVIVGAVHTPGQHTVRKRGYSTSADFIDNRARPVGKRTTYLAAEALMRRYELFPEAPEDELLVNRALLESLMVVFVPEFNLDVLGEIIRQLSDSEIINILERLEKASKLKDQRQREFKYRSPVREAYKKGLKRLELKIKSGAYIGSTAIANTR